MQTTDQIIALIAQQANVALTDQNKMLIEANLQNIFMVLATHNKTN